MIKLPQTLPEKTLLVRVEELQASIAHRILAAYRTGVRKAPPADLVGARHVVMVKETPDGLCEFEEGPGPARHMGTLAWAADVSSSGVRRQITVNCYLNHRFRN